MSPATCTLCDESGGERHHITGRSAPGAPYLDRELTVLLCIWCHNAVHAVLRRLDLEFPQVDPCAHRLRRLASFFRMCAERGRSLTLTPATLFALAAILEACARELQQGSIR